MIRFHHHHHHIYFLKQTLNSDKKTQTGARKLQDQQSWFGVLRFDSILMQFDLRFDLRILQLDLKNSRIAANRNHYFAPFMNWMAVAVVGRLKMQDWKMTDNRFICNVCNCARGSRVGLFSQQKTHRWDPSCRRLTPSEAVLFWRKPHVWSFHQKMT